MRHPRHYVVQIEWSLKLNAASASCNCADLFHALSDVFTGAKLPFDDILPSLGH